MPRSEQFYLEFLALTVLSLLAANIWIRFVVRLLDAHGSSTGVDLVIAMAVTLVAFLLMRTFFTHTPGEGVDEEPSYQEELFATSEGEK